MLILKSTVVTSLIAFVALACNHGNDRPTTPGSDSTATAGTSSSAVNDPYGTGNGAGTPSDGAPFNGDSSTDSGSNSSGPSNSAGTAGSTMR